jgi:hypothetical protein
MDLFPFYMTLVSTFAVSAIAMYAFVRFFLNYRESLIPSSLYLSTFFLAFSINHLAMALRVVTGLDLMFYDLSNIFGPMALVFITAFAVSLIRPGKEKGSFLFSVPMYLIFLASSFFVDKSIEPFYPGVSEIVYPMSYVVITLLTVTVLGFFVSFVFFFYSFNVRWSALKRGGVMMASGFLTIAVFTYLFDWPGLLGFLLPVTRLMAVIGISLVYLGARRIQRARVPSL